MAFMTAFVAAICVLIGVVVLWYVARALRVWRYLRSERVVTCPETGRPAAVRIDARHAAMTELSRTDRELRLAACSRWPERGPCDEACLYEAQDPESRVIAIAAHWYAGKTCMYCRQPLREDPVAGHHVAFLRPDGSTREWSDVSAEALDEALRTGRPVCWNCHVAETFRRTYPELVTDRTNIAAH
jgi:hypothetical protein